MNPFTAQTQVKMHVRQTLTWRRYKLSFRRELPEEGVFKDIYPYLADSHPGVADPSAGRVG